MISDLKEIFLVSDPIDMRKSINSLTIFVDTSLKENPTSGAGFVFYNAAKDKVKILYFSNNGFVLFYKRFEKSRVKLPSLKPKMQKINHIQLLAFLLGLEIENLKTLQPIIYTEF